MMKQHSNPTTNHPRLPTVCRQCAVEDPKFLHNVRHRGNLRRLCTSCVLRLHPQSFCLACLGVYDRSPPFDAVVCLKCYSSSHPNCVSSPPAGTIASSRSPPCSSCLNPNLYVLNLNRLENGSRNGGRAIDVNAAKLLLAAGKIASMSMNKAEVAAAMEAERRSKEAAYTKKRAREALDHVVSLMCKEKRNGAESNKKVWYVNNTAVAMPPAVAAVAVDANAINNEIDASSEVVDEDVVNNKSNASSKVLEALNVVELKESGLGLPVVPVEIVVSEVQGDGVVVMEVDVVKGKDSGVNSIGGNESVTNDDTVKIAQNGLEQALQH